MGRCQFLIFTMSDWTTFKILEPSSMKISEKGRYDRVYLGQDAPGFSYHIDPQMIRINKEMGDGSPVLLEVTALLEGQRAEGVFELTKSDLEGTTVVVKAFNDDTKTFEELAVLHNYEQRGHGDPRNTMVYRIKIP